MFGIGNEALSGVREWSRCYPKCPGVVGRPFWMSGRGREAHPNVWEWSGNPHWWSAGLP